MLIKLVVAQRTAMAAQLLCRALKQKRSHFVVVGCGHILKELLAQVVEHRPDVAVVSSILEGDPRGGLEVVRALRNFGSITRSIMLLDCSDSELVVKAFSAGAKGVVCQTEPLEVLCKCIRCVHAGQIWANSRELQWIIKSLGDIPSCYWIALTRSWWSKPSPPVPKVAFVRPNPSKYCANVFGVCTLGRFAQYFEG